MQGRPDHRSSLGTFLELLSKQEPPPFEIDWSRVWQYLRRRRSRVHILRVHSSRKPLVAWLVVAVLLTLGSLYVLMRL